MKIVALSDLHIDESWRVEAGLNIPLEVIVNNIVRQQPDITLLGGDLAQSKEVLEFGLKQLAKIPGTKLAYLGNHEMKSPDNEFGKHYEEMADLFSGYDFHLLDYKPFTTGKLAFVGNSGWFDFSLYQGHYLEQRLAKALASYHQKYKTNISPAEFTRKCIERINEHLHEVSSAEQIFLGIHHIGFKELLKYGHSREFDFGNLFMGSEHLRLIYYHPKIKIGFCGHNHRPGIFPKEGFTLYNTSSTYHQPFQVIEV